MTSKPTSQPLQDDPAESKRFIDMARALEADEGEGAMDKAFNKVVLPPHDTAIPRPKQKPGP